jgi:hypothetical protein
VPLTQSQPPLSSSSSSSSSSSQTTIAINQNYQQQQQQQNPPLSSSPNQIQPSTSTTILVERSPLTNTRSSHNQHYHRRSSSHNLLASNTSINILPSTTQRTTDTLLNSHRTPADQIEDQLVTSCCFVGSVRSDRKKTLSACLLALCTLYFCSFIITIVDERLPDPKTFHPLPDLILDNIKQIPWAFAVTEKIIVIEMLSLLTVIVLHRHR